LREQELIVQIDELLEKETKLANDKLDKVQDHVKFIDNFMLEYKSMDTKDSDIDIL
jgi:hypothetical protein